MSTINPSLTPVVTDPSGSDGASRALLPDLLRSEWTKLRSVPSTAWTLLVTVVATVGLGALFCAIYVSRHGKSGAFHRIDFTPTSASLSGIALAQLAVAVLGVLVISSEYSTGMIRVTLASVPQRRTLFAARALVLSATLLVVGIVSSFVAFFLGQAILSGGHLQTTIGAPGVLRAVVGAGLYLTVVGLLALGLGTLLRSTAGAIAAVVGLLLVLPGLVRALPSDWANAIDKYLPGEAGQAIFNVHTQAHMLSPWAGFAVFCAYAAAALLGAGYLLHRRDA